MVVSRAGSFLVKSVLPKCTCEFTAVSYFLGFVICGFFFLFFPKDKDNTFGQDLPVWPVLCSNTDTTLFESQAER